MDYGGRWGSVNGGSIMLGIGGVLVELAASGDMVSWLGRRFLCRAIMRMVITMVAGLREERAIFALIPSSSFYLLQPFQ